MEQMVVQVAIALVWAWLGLVVGLSFVEAPLKFRAPGITRELGLGIGRLVFKALNGIEIVLTVLIAIFLVVDDGDAGLNWPYWLLAALLLTQTVMLHGFMDKRAARIVAGETLPPSKQHYAYIGLEMAKVILLVVLGTMLLGELAG
jgi:hypothetical protein